MSGKSLPEKAPLDPFSISEIGLQITNRCNCSCPHCGSASGPTGTNGPSLQWCKQFVGEIKHNGFTKLMITGGEPMLRIDVLLPTIEIAANMGIEVELVTNGYWGTTPHTAAEILDSLSSSGLSALTISVDLIHSQCVPLASLVNIAASIKAANFPFSLRIYGLKGKFSFEEGIQEVVSACGGQCKVFHQPILPVGRARLNARQLAIKGWELQPEDTHPCHMVLYPFISATKEWYICSNGAAIGKNIPLCIGILTNPSELGRLLKQHMTSPVFRALRNIGPVTMAEWLGLPSPVGREYVSICDFCLHELFSIGLHDTVSTLTSRRDFLSLLDDIEEYLLERLGEKKGKTATHA